MLKNILSASVFFTLAVCFVVPASANLQCKQRIDVQTKIKSPVAENIGESSVVKQIEERMSGKLYLKDQTLFSCMYSNKKIGIQLNVQAVGRGLKMTLSQLEYWEGQGGEFSSDLMEVVIKSKNLRGKHSGAVFSTRSSYDEGCGWAECANPNPYEDIARHNTGMVSEIIVK